MMSLMDAVAVVETLDVADQRKLRSLLSEALYKKQPVHKIRRGEQFDALVASGLVVKIDDPDAVVLSDQLGKVRKKLCTYLSRRNESEPCVDENGDPYTIPSGASFVAAASLSEPPALSIVFPEDEITALLDLHGVNRCRGWKP